MYVYGTAIWCLIACVHSSATWAGIHKCQTTHRLDKTLVTNHGLAGASHPNVLSRSDKRVINQLLLFLDKRFGNNLSASRRRIPAICMTSLKWVDISADYLEQLGFGRPSLLAKLVQDAKQRNSKPIDFKKHQFPSGFRLAPPGKMALFADEMRTERKQTTPYLVWTCLPGYSPGNTDALAIFMYDDGGRHGASIGMAHFIKNHNAWQLKKLQTVDRG